MCTYIAYNIFASRSIFYVRQAVCLFMVLLPRGEQNIHDIFIKYNIPVIKHFFIQNILYLNRAEHSVSVKTHRH